ncbi:MAG: hypothetical protein JWM68_1881 [Verrucomicrobiales bacterium]|nr:hypothetical protein [Verrucomicrobiales bacterium]
MKTIPEIIVTPEQGNSKDATQRPVEQQRVKLADLVASAETKSRELNKATVDEYAALWREGVNFTPVDVFDIGDALHVVDGFHRTQSALDAGFTEIDATIHKGTLVEALKYSLRANSAHGLRRSHKDKHYAVKRALAAFPEQSSNSLAQMTGVSRTFVESVRAKLASETQHATDACSEVRLGSDGKKRRVRKAGARLNEVETPKSGADEPEPESVCPPPSSRVDDLEYASSLFSQYLDALQAAKSSMPNRNTVVDRASAHLVSHRNFLSLLKQA